LSHAAADFSPSPDKAVLVEPWLLGILVAEDWKSIVIKNIVAMEDVGV